MRIRVLAPDPKPKTMAKSYGFGPSKGLGQNLLVDRGAIRKIITAAEIKPSDTILEIGPGLGVLTKELAKKAKKVVAVEKDKNLVRILEKDLKPKNLESMTISLKEIRAQKEYFRLGQNETQELFDSIG